MNWYYVLEWALVTFNTITGVVCIVATVRLNRTRREMLRLIDAYHERIIAAGAQESETSRSS